ncbi:MAG: gliding motility-associated ABC transporter substrate-binding protein GldG [Spirosomataceae bacterium]
MNTKPFRFLLILAGLLGLNVLANLFFFRVDLTEEKRYSLSEGTVNLLENLPSDVVVKVYLDGDMPAGFKRLQAAVRETLEEFKVYGGTKLNYRFINPDDFQTEKERKAFYEEMLNRGMVPTNVVDKKGGQRTEKAIFPWALVSADTLETKTLLLKGSRLASAQEQLNQSYEGVEYQLASAISQLTPTTHKRIGILNSVSKVPAGRLSDAIVSLQKKYDLFQVDLAKSPNLSGLDAILMVKPDVAFTDDDKFKLDQFVMHGGKAVFFVDALKVDSIGREGTYAQPNSLDLDDLFFKWGVRVNTNLVKDLELCGAIPLNVGVSGDKPNIQVVPWRFFPLLNNFSKSPIVRNLDAVYAHFAGTIDTVQAPGIVKTPLLMTSAYTQVLNAPVLVSYNEARRQPNPRDYKAGVKTVAYLLEGTFTSLYQNRILPSDPRSADFKAKSPVTSIMICSDGDIPQNEWDYKRNVPYPLGYDRFSQQTFANKDFVLNVFDYLLDENGVIESRNKEVKLRPLDKIQLAEKRTFWQVINIGAPLVLIALLGLAWQAWRKKKYAA